jgi:serine/threonine protein kinase
MPPPSDLQRLSDPEWKELQVRADRFAEDLAGKGNPDWNAHLAGMTGNLRQAVLHEFIKIDLEHAWKSGRKATLDDYVNRFPELGGTQQLPAHLVYEEFRVRQSQGDRPDPGSFFSRFPHLSDTLRSMFGEKSQQPTEWGTMVQGAHPPKAPIDQTMNLPASVSAESVLPAVGEYQLVTMLGKGQFGEVWRARAPGGVEVAVKVITQPADQETAQRELKALELVKNLRHPCLMSTLAFWTHQNKVYIVVELADGTIRDRLKESRAEGKTGIPVEELVGYFASAADGLDFLHSKHVFHRDIKPDNILLVNGHAKVADFGLARAGERPDMSVSFAGTPVYMAPEVWGGKYNPQSDLYSLAVTYVEARLGRRPLEANDFVELMNKQRESPPDLEGLPPAEQVVLRKALAKQADRRQRTCKEFVAELRTAVAPATPAAKRRSAIPLVAGIAVVALLAGGLAAWAVLSGGKSDPTSLQAGMAAPTSNTTSPVVAPPSPITAITTVSSTLSIPPANPLATPDGYRAVDAGRFRMIGNRRYAERIERDAMGGIRPTFALVEPVGGSPIYVMETKAWNGLLAELLRADGPWKGKPPEEVAFGMTAADAFRCAKKLGGRLPTPAEWDAAIGYSPAGQGKLYASGHPAFDRAEPRRADDPGREVASTGITDFAGNGREWTAEQISVPDGRRLPLPDSPKEDALVVLRGWSYTLGRAMAAADLAAEQDEPQTQFAGKGSRFTSFRVVVPAP